MATLQRELQQALEQAPVLLIDLVTPFSPWGRDGIQKHTGQKWG